MSVHPYAMPQTFISRMKDDARKHHGSKNWGDDLPAETQAAIEHMSGFGHAFREDNVKFVEWMEGLNHDSFKTMSPKMKTTIIHAMSYRPSIPTANAEMEGKFDAVRKGLLSCVQQGTLMKSLVTARTDYIESANKMRAKFVRHLGRMDSAMKAGPDETIEWLGGLSGFHREDMRFERRDISAKIAKKIEKVQANGGPTTDSGMAALETLQSALFVVNDEVPRNGRDVGGKLKDRAERYSASMKMG